MQHAGLTSRIIAAAIDVQLQYFNKPTLEIKLVIARPIEREDRGEEPCYGFLIRKAGNQEDNARKAPSDCNRYEMAARCRPRSHDAGRCFLPMASTPIAMI